MCIRDRAGARVEGRVVGFGAPGTAEGASGGREKDGALWRDGENCRRGHGCSGEADHAGVAECCRLYTSDAADDM
eukprot:11750895-Alexandrium_andersonii.AAC.1